MIFLSSSLPQILRIINQLINVSVKSFEFRMFHCPGTVLIIQK